MPTRRDQSCSQAIEASGYADVYPESYEGHYTFAPESAPVCFEDGIAAAKVVPGYQLKQSLV